MRNTAIYALTPHGARLARTLADQLDADLFLPARLADSGYGGSSTHKAIRFDRLLDVVGENFSLYRGQIFVAASGIVVRAIAPHLTYKNQDPGVVVIDQEGKHAISLLSGHLGGANELAHKVAQLTGGKAVITTATDTAGVPSVDLLAKERNLVILNQGAVKCVNMAILQANPVQVFDPEDRLGLKKQEKTGLAIEQIENEDQWISSHSGVWVTWKSKKPDPALSQLVLHPKCLVAGVGCNTGTESHEILDLITRTFKENALALKSLKCLTTIEAKKDERGLKEAARELDVPLIFFDSSEIQSIDAPHPSNVVKKHMGVSSVCEATALLKSGKGQLLVPKTKSPNATLAVALESLP